MHYILSVDRNYNQDTDEDEDEEESEEESEEDEDDEEDNDYKAMGHSCGYQQDKIKSVKTVAV